MEKLEIFDLGDAYTFGVTKAKGIAKKIVGRIAGQPHDYGVLAQCVHDAGPGDWLEIGALYGGSAILMAMVKRHYGIDGRIYSVDPFDGYYTEKYGPENNIDPKTPTVPISLETAMGNARIMDVSDYIEFIQGSSPKINLPDNVKLVGAFVDGNHWGSGPQKDFSFLHPLVSDYIVFDNYDKVHPDVVALLRYATANDWTPIHISGITAVLRKE